MFEKNTSETKPEKAIKQASTNGKPKTTDTTTTTTQAGRYIFTLPLKSYVFAVNTADIYAQAINATNGKSINHKEVSSKNKGYPPLTKQSLKFLRNFYMKK
ncbi:MAG: hypothetical protein FWG63_03795 [Defluviitaleaceae bacterium]|nr:hypothetical protein [Defluviitaleaceae bacterium]